MQDFLVKPLNKFTPTEIRLIEKWKKIKIKFLNGDVFITKNKIESSMFLENSSLSYIFRNIKNDLKELLEVVEVE